MADVFLSYASVDGDQAQGVAGALEQHGLSVWWDRHLLSGERFQQSIQRELVSATAVVVLWTKGSVESEWVYSEARRGHQRKALVQLRADDIGIDDLPAPFDGLHCPFVDDTDALLRSVDALVQRVPGVEPVQPSRPAPAVVAPGRERKIVTVLVADFQSAVAVDPEDVESRHSPFHAGCQQVIERFGGTVERLAGDAIMAAFGAPTAHEDDPERAVRAALGMREAVEQLDSERKVGLSIRIGVATGEALVSRSVPTGIGEPMVTGQVVKTAQQLQSAGPVGGVLVDQGTYLSSRASTEFESHEVADPAVPPSVWLALASRGSVGEDLADTTRPMIGREDELAQLQRSFSRAVRESSVQLVTIVAEPGLGKSRLMQAFRDWLQVQEELVTWRQGKCPPYGDSVAYAALAEVVKAQSGILDSDPAEVVQSKLVGAITALVEGTELDDERSWLAARLAPLVGLPTTEAPREELFTAWRRFLEALAATGPLVVVVEDLHWADPALLDFLTHLLEWTVGVPLVIVATARPELYDKAPAWAAGHRSATTLSLAPLDDHECAELVASLLGTKTLPAELHAALLAKAAGNPLYAREYLTILSDRAEPELDETRVQELADTMPGSVQAVIAARLDTLPPDSKQLLQAAAVVGHTFWSGVVAALTGVDDATVRTRLHDLVRRDYLRPSRVSRIADQAEYTFGHALIADVAYGQLPRKERARHHQAVADWHRARIADPDTSSDSAVVAHHYLQAHQISRTSEADTEMQVALAASAATWHTHAAEHARQSDTSTALDLARTAVDLTPEGDPLRPSRQILLGELETTSGQQGRAETTFNEARSAAERCGNQLVAADAQVHQSDSIRNQGRPDEADALLAAAIALLEDQPPGQELVAAYLSRAGAYHNQGRLSEARESVDRALALTGQLDVPTPLLVRALLRRGSVRTWSGDPEGVEDLTRALDLAERHNLTRSIVWCNDTLATWYVFARTAPEALGYGQAAVRTCEMTGAHRPRLTASSNLADLLVILGRLDEAFEVYENAADTRVDSPSNLAAMWVTWADAHLVRGDLEAAHALIERAWPISRDDSPDVKYRCLLVATELHQLGQHPSDENSYEHQLTGLLEDSETHEFFGQYLARLARVLAGCGRVDVLEKVIESAPAGMVFYDNHTLAARAVLAQAQQEFAQAQALHEQAAGAWAAYGYPLEQAHALIGAAHCLSALDQPAREPLEQAHAILAEIGAGPLLAETDRLLAAAVH